MGVNLRTEDFAFEAPAYRDDMIIVAPQLSDWGQTSADQTIALNDLRHTQNNLPGRVALKPVPVITALNAGGGMSIWAMTEARLWAPRCTCPPPTLTSMAAQVPLGMVMTASTSCPLESR